MGVKMQKKSDSAKGKKLLVTQLFLLSVALILNLSIAEKSVLVWTATALLALAFLLTATSVWMSRRHRTD
ncbi:hypothetical protein ACWGQ2_13165 [Arthrobacter sp. NPDC055585]